MKTYVLNLEGPSAVDQEVWTEDEIKSFKIERGWVHVTEKDGSEVLIPDHKIDFIRIYDSEIL